MQGWNPSTRQSYSLKNNNIAIKNINKSQKSSSEKGITLLTLVITIIIIIILATVTINLAIGDGGLIGQAENVRDMAEESIQTESERRNNLAEELAELIPFEPQDTPEPESGGSDFTMTYGVIEIKWLQGTTNNVSEVPNEPVTKRISNGTMELVRFDEESQEWVSGVEYSYEKGTGIEDNNQSKWANAKVTIDGVESYFVWIPRYAYRIVYFKDEPSKNEYKTGAITEEEAIAQGKLVGYSDSRGIVTADGKRVDSVTSESNTTHTMVSEDYFMTHPAFLDGTDTGFENGEWEEELEGIWIGKYESARKNATSTNEHGGSPIIKIQPGVVSWKNTTIGSMYTYSLNYSKELKSHMLKNSEWGVVAYLTESTYGRNGTEIEHSGTMVTGGGAEKAYIENTNQSSTGNVYGIYDLRGGGYEYSAAYYIDGEDTYLNNGLEFTSTKTSDAYSTVYDGTITSENYKYGDATYETRGWHSDGFGLHTDTTIFLKLDAPFFIHGSLSTVLYEGLFTYRPSAGRKTDSYNSFRIAIVV